MTKEIVYEVLSKNLKSYVSGETLAKETGLSRTAIWKAIRLLREDGLKIEASTKNGYMLMAPEDLLSKSVIDTMVENGRVIVLDEIDSTNNYLRRLAENGAEEKTIVVASRQTGGKGRLGRVFFSPDTGLYFSFLVRPKHAAFMNAYITAVAGVATAMAIEEETGKKLSIKWVNDLFDDVGKVCGILSEGKIDMESGTTEYVVVGIGIDVYEPDGGFPEELKRKAHYLEKNKVQGLRNRLVSRIVNVFFELFESFDKAKCLKFYRDRSCVLNKEVLINKGNDMFWAKAISIDEDFGLVVEKEDGKVETLTYGDVSIKEMV